MKDKFSKLVKNAEDLKRQAAKLSSEAKTIAKKASGVIDGEKIGQGLEMTSKGVELAAKGARTVAGAMEKASQGIRKVGSKLRKDK